MRPHGSQQWRPKPKLQCAPDVVSIDQVNCSEEVNAMTVDSESGKPESRVSSSVEVTKLVIQSMKKNRAKLKRKIEAATNTSISISKQKTGCFVVVEGASDDAVKQATKRLQDLLEKVDGKVDDKAGGTGTESVQSLQWVPKAVRGLHTSSADKMKESSSSNQELDEIEEADTVSGSIHVDKKLLRLIKGHKDEVKERIEKSTNTSILIGSPVVVEGTSEESVQKALEEIQRVIDEGVADSKFQYSHFISLPLSMHGSLVKKLEEFQESVLVMLGIPLTEEATAEGAPKMDEKPEASEEPKPGVPGAASEMGEETETEAAAETESKVDKQADRDNSTNAEGSEAQISAVTNELFEQSVLSSLGIDPEEARRQELANSIFKDAVLVSLGIPADNSQNEDNLQSAQENTEREEVESVVELAECVAEEDNADALMDELGEAVKGTDTEASMRDNAGVKQEVIEVVSERDNVEVPMEEPEYGATTTDDPGVMQEEKVVEEVAEDVQENVNTLKKGEFESGAEETKETEDYEPLKEVAFSKKKISASGVERSIFIKPSRFHLTVLMLKLWNEERVEKAREVLQNCLPKVVTALDGKPVSVSLTGLEIMRGSPKNTRVLYAKVTETDGEDRLSRACQVIIDDFVESGLVLGKDREQALKLHATVMNTSHRRSKSKYKNRGFDATEILAKFGEESWGDHQILEAHLSERFKYDESGYYHCCGSIPFPGNGKEIDVKASCEVVPSEEKPSNDQKDIVVKVPESANPAF